MSGEAHPRPGSPPLRILLMASVRWYNACAAYAVDLAGGLRERGHDVRTIVRPGSPAEHVGRRRGLDVWSEADLTELRPDRAFRHLAALRRLIAGFRPQVVNPHRSEDHLFAALALRGSGIPLVRTRGDVRPPRPNPANRFLYGRATARNVAAADFMPRRFFPPLGIDPASVAVIRPGIDVDAFTRGAPDAGEARRRLDLEGGAPWIGLVGRFTAAKGHGVLLEAFASLPPLRGKLPRLLLSGVENEIRIADLRSRAEALGVADRVAFRDRGDDVRLLLRALDVLAVPSVSSEAMCRIGMEGMALGIPVVAAATNSLPEVVGDAGLVVPPRDAPSLAAALARMLADDALRERCRAAGPERMRRRYDRGEQLRRTEALFLDLVRPPEA